MWAGLSCFLSSGVGYVGELLELQHGLTAESEEELKSLLMKAKEESEKVA